MLPKANEWKAKRNKWDGTIDPRYVDELQATADRRKELLRRMDGHICHHEDCISMFGWDDTKDNYCDCAHPDLLDELAKELADG